MQKTKYFTVKLIAPRPTFLNDMSEIEQEFMARHLKFWQKMLDSGKALVFGPVYDTKGVYGFGIITAESMDEANNIVKTDPILSLCGYEVFEMKANVSKNFKAQDF